MKYTLQHLEEKDYKVLAEWWEFWWKKKVPREALPDKLSDGILIKVDGVPACAGFLYATSSRYVFWMEFIISNPDIKDKEARAKSINFTVRSLIELAQKAGALSIFSSIKHPSLKEVYKRNGFIESETKMSNFVYNFNH